MSRKDEWSQQYPGELTAEHRNALEDARTAMARVQAARKAWAEEEEARAHEQAMLAGVDPVSQNDQWLNHGTSCLINHGVNRIKSTMVKLIKNAAAM